jgi:hypothetical protein
MGARGLGLIRGVELADPATRTGRVDLRAPGRARADLWTTGFDLGPTHLGAVASAGAAPVLRVAELPAALAAPLGCLTRPEVVAPRCHQPSEARSRPCAGWPPC